MKHEFKKSGGFSLLEMSLVVMIMGAMGTAVWQFLPQLKALIAQQTVSDLAKSDEALNGFILVNSRLPCPDTTGTGIENCNANPDGTFPIGWIPFKTMGLNLSQRVRYGVYRQPAAAAASVTSDADLAVLKDRFQPQLPSGSSNRLNGLDFCVGLRNLAMNAGASLTGLRAYMVFGASQQSVPIAYGLAVGGAHDADNDGSLFDGSNMLAGRFAATGTAHSSIYDDETITVGIGELFTRIGCASRLAETNSAVRAAYAAYDIDRIATTYIDFRTFAIQVRNQVVTAANVSIALSTADLAISVGTSWSSVALMAETAGTTAYTVPLAVAAVAGATAGLAAAIVSKVKADQALSLAQSKLAPAVAFKGSALTSGTAYDLDKAVTRAMTLDQKGLLP